MIDKIVNDINIALKNGAYLSALSLALTLPDVCGKAEYSTEKSNGKRYKDWYNKYIGQYETDGQTDCPYLSGEVVYSLRNSFLHQTTPNVDKTKIHDSQNKIDEFVLVLEPKNEFDIYADLSMGDFFGIKSYYVSVQRLCLILTRSALGYYNQNKEKFSFIQYQVRYE